jgi:hypothetical protein
MSVERAMKAVFKGPEVKKLEVGDHEFNVKPAEISRNGTTRTANGQISHHLSFRPDDQVFYTIVKQGDVVKSQEVRISRGGAAPFVAPLISAASAYLGKPVPPDKVEEVGRGLGKFIEGSWEEVAQMLVGNIALRL